MGKQLINSVTLMAFVVYSICGTGCTSITRIPIEEVSTVPDKKITQLRLNDGAQVNLSGQAIEYDYSYERFMSALPDGSRRGIFASVVDTVYYVTDRDSLEQSQTYGAFRSDEFMRLNGKWRGVIRGMSTGDTHYEFDGHHGTIDSLNHTVFGVSKLGDSLYVPFENITTLKVRRFSADKTTLLIIGLGALGLFVGVGIAFATSY